MGLREEISKHEEDLIKNGWSIMPKGEVNDENSLYKIFKYSDKVDLCAVCEIRKHNEEYKVLYRIKDLLGNQLDGKKDYGDEEKVVRWLIQFVSGEADPYFCGNTDNKKIKAIYEKYKRKPEPKQEPKPEIIFSK